MISIIEAGDRLDTIYKMLDVCLIASRYPDELSDGSLDETIWQIMEKVSTLWHELRRGQDEQKCQQGS